MADGALLTAELKIAGRLDARFFALLEALRVVGSLRLVVFAALLTLCVIFLPGGLVSLWRRYAGRQAAGGAS